ncbi:MAG TPA: 4Fe-4S dicluster domain-containing protein [Bacteroidales bacterium]|nr:4Fe-4S dicluster domain-containing protein [Bacteroidales bacterium]
MRSHLLSKIRAWLSVLVILVTAALFLDISHLIPEKVTGGILFLQFIPSANKVVGAGAAAAGFIIVTALTILSGRLYCSFLCPLGIVQDIFSRVGGMFRKKFRKYGFRRAHTILRYSILALTLIVSLTWGIALLMVLDPYSIFGRMMTYFGKPIVMLLNNLLAGVFGKFHIYTFVHSPLPWFGTVVYIIPLIFLALVGYMSFRHGRLYCNTVCPVGTFLGLLSKVSFLRIRFDNDKCSKCGRCAVACKSSCIDFMNKEVDLSRCVDCFNCIKSCPDKALLYGPLSLRKAKSPETPADRSKRKSLLAVILFLSGTRIISGQNKAAPVPKKASTVKEKKTSSICPPGSGSIEKFVRNCTACSLCVSACPNNVLVPSFREYGLSSVMQPHMDFHKGFCAYECVRCLEICPTGALMPLALEAKKLTQIGKAVFIKDNCIVNTEHTACGACSEACPTKAVHMIPFMGHLVIPETNDEICIGCGHCENACPTTPYKAIFINGNPVHKAAKKPVNTRTDLKKPDDFPF